MDSLSKKVALVTGSSRGIGAQIAKTLASAGAKVVVNFAHDQSSAETVVAAIESKGGHAMAIKADITQSAAVTSLFDQAIEAWGKIDILVNNAGALLNRKVADTSDEDLDKLLATNVKGTFYALREAATRLADGGRIVNMSSSTTRVMLPTYGGYCATKGAVEQLTRVFAKEIGSRGITVNAVAPGPTETELFFEGKSEEMVQQLASMSAFNRLGTPNDIAQVVLFLASDESAWVSGQILAANGGFA